MQIKTIIHTTEHSIILMLFIVKTGLPNIKSLFHELNALGGNIHSVLINV